MGRLLRELEAAYGDQPTYHVLARVFTEHFRPEPEGLRVKEASELSASSLQSPDDLEATYREKRGEGHRGYVANLTETYDPENPVQLITKVQVAPNTTDDTALLAEALSDLKARTGWRHSLPMAVSGARTTMSCCEHQVTLVQTAIRGRPRDPERFYLDDFQVQPDGSGLPERAICPLGTAGEVRPSRSGKTFVAVFAREACAGCAERALRPVVERKRSGSSSCALRPKIGGERNVGVRLADTRVPGGTCGREGSRCGGRFRVACMVIGSASGDQIVRRLHRFLQGGAGHKR